MSNSELHRKVEIPATQPGAPLEHHRYSIYFEDHIASARILEPATNIRFFPSDKVLIGNIFEDHWRWSDDAPGHRFLEGEDNLPNVPKSSKPSIGSFELTAPDLSIQSNDKTRLIVVGNDIDSLRKVLQIVEENIPTVGALETKVCLGISPDKYEVIHDGVLQGFNIDRFSQTRRNQSIN